MKTRQREEIKAKSNMFPMSPAMTTSKYGFKKNFLKIAAESKIPGNISNKILIIFLWESRKDIVDVHKRRHE